MKKAALLLASILAGSVAHADTPHQRSSHPLIPAAQAHASFNSQEAKNVEWATTHGCNVFTTGPGAPDKSYKDRDGYCFIGLDVDPNQ